MTTRPFAIRAKHTQAQACGIQTKKALWGMNLKTEHPSALLLPQRRRYIKANIKELGLPNRRPFFNLPLVFAFFFSGNVFD